MWWPQDPRRAALPCPCLLRRACLLLPVLCGASCSFQVLCKNSVSDITWREIEFSPIFLTIPNAIIFISRALSKENASGGLSLAHLAEHGHVSELKRDEITYIFKGKFVCMCLDSDAKPTMFQFLLLYLFYTRFEIFISRKFIKIASLLALRFCSSHFNITFNQIDEP